MARSSDSDDRGNAADRPQDPLVGRRRPDPSQPPEPTKVLEGALGDSDRPASGGCTSARISTTTRSSVPTTSCPWRTSHPTGHRCSASRRRASRCAATRRSTSREPSGRGRWTNSTWTSGWRRAGRRPQRSRRSAAPTLSSSAARSSARSTPSAADRRGTAARRRRVAVRRSRSRSAEGATCLDVCETRVRTFCEQATCDTCRTRCGQDTCRTCNQATCQTCNQATCQTCNTCQTRCGQATCQTCQTRCNQATCRTCETRCGTCNPHVFTCGNQCVEP